MCNCHECGKECKSNGFSTGYGVDANGNKICYECCAKHDEQALMALEGKNKICLYLTGKAGEEMISNWPGTLKIKPTLVKHGKRRTDVWFTHKGKKFHGTQYGENTEVCHIRAVAR